MRPPNFFIVGAPKCGTSSLAHYLGEHPRIFMCRPKEPKFFANELGGMRIVTTLDEYLALFLEADETHLAVGEASVWYLYFREALSRIKRFDPRARIIVMVRNPVEVVPALHSQCLLSSLETETDFRRAWELQASRARGRDLPRHCPHAKILQYRDAAMLGAQVEYLLSVFDRSQVHAILFDDLQSLPRTVYEAALEFLQVPDDGRNEFPRINANRRYRSRGLGRINRWSSGPWGRVAGAVKQALGIRGPVGLWERWRGLNLVIKPRPPMQEEFRRSIAREFEADVERLSELIGRDLGHWLRVPPRSGGGTSRTVPSPRAAR